MIVIILLFVTLLIGGVCLWDCHEQAKEDAYRQSLTTPEERRRLKELAK